MTNNNNKNGGKLMPNLDQDSTKALNLTVLQRMDPHIEEILNTAAHVTLYDFNVNDNQWSRKDVEGSLFVVKRNTPPRFQFIVMNRRNTENLVEDLLGDFEFELQVPYLLYRNPKQQVNGIWFYNAPECEEVAKLFNRILSAFSKVSPKSKVNKNEFEELEAVPTSAVPERQLELPFATSSSTDVQEDSSIANFFSNAHNLGHNNSSNSATSIQTYNNPTNIPLSSRVSPSPVLNNGPTIQMNSYPPTIYDNPDPVNSSNHVNNFIKPVPFFTPSPSSSHMIQQTVSSVPVTPLNIQRSHGVPLLQPFPPPTPPSSLTPNSFSPASYGPLTREKVRDAIVLLAQDNQFIDMFHQALLRAHQS